MSTYVPGKQTMALINKYIKNRDSITSQFIPSHTLLLTKHPLYWVWACAKKRCCNPKYKGYKWYGARGITMHPAWLNDANAFIKWCEHNGYKKGLHLDRIDNNGNYEPSNIRFITHQENQRNRKDNRIIEYKGERLAMSAFVEKYVIVSYSAFWRRLNKNWSLEDAAFTPAKTKNQYFNQTKNS